MCTSMVMAVCQKFWNHFTCTLEWLLLKEEEERKKEQVLTSMWRSWNPDELLVGMYSSAAAVENSVASPQK